MHLGILSFIGTTHIANYNCHALKQVQSCCKFAASTTKLDHCIFCLLFHCSSVSMN
jgi:hypothetical protein